MKLDNYSVDEFVYQHAYLGGSTLYSIDSTLPFKSDPNTMIYPQLEGFLKGRTGASPNGVFSHKVGPLSYKLAYKFQINSFVQSLP